jgi:hypothetical protein
MTWARVGNTLHVFLDGRRIASLTGGDLARLAQDACAAALHDASKT